MVSSLKEISIRNLDETAQTVYSERTNAKAGGFNDIISEIVENAKQGIVDAKDNKKNQSLGLDMAGALLASIMQKVENTGFMTGSEAAQADYNSVEGLGSDAAKAQIQQAYFEQLERAVAGDKNLNSALLKDISKLLKTENNDVPDDNPLHLSDTDAIMNVQKTAPPEAQAGQSFEDAAAFDLSSDAWLPDASPLTIKAETSAADSGITPSAYSAAAPMTDMEQSILGDKLTSEITAAKNGEGKAAAEAAGALADGGLQPAEISTDDGAKGKEPQGQAGEAADRAKVYDFGERVHISSTAKTPNLAAQQGNAEEKTPKPNKEKLADMPHEIIQKNMMLSAETRNSAEINNEPILQLGVDEVADVFKNHMIERSVFLEKDGRQELKVQLKPESLGKLTINIKNSEDGMKIVINVDNRGGKEALIGQAVQMREAIEAQGIEISDINIVYSGLQGDGQGFREKNNFKFNTKNNTGRAKIEYEQSAEDTLQVSGQLQINPNGTVSYLV